MPPRKDRTKPTAYPFLPFHVLRSAQLVSSIIVAGIMAYFLWQLEHEGYRLPWTFILLLLVSLLTIASLTITIILHIFHGLSPVLNLALNAILLLLWTISFAMLSWWSSSTLSHVCNRRNWGDDMGVGVCREYKALFSFALIGCVSTLAALLLDAHIRRQSIRRGKYNAMSTIQDRDADHKLSDRAAGSPTSYDHFDDVDTEYNPNPSVRAKKTTRGGQGYEIPDEQFRYEDEGDLADLGERTGRR